MEESFSVRVSKTFDILDGSSPSATASAPSSSLWSLTGEEIEKREWNRDKGSPEPQPRPCNPDSNSKDDFFGNELEKDLLDLDDDDDDVEKEEEEDEVVEEQSAKPKPKPKPKPMPDDYNEEQWQIKTCIGLDCTLDHEEEEDEFDKVAVGKGNAADRFYMKDVNDYPIDIDSQYEVPNSLNDFTRDPRANHLAAKIRLQLDAEAARKIDSLRVSGNTAPSGAIADEFVPSEDAINLKSILKRKNDEQLGSSKSQKRVRFDPECKDDCDEEPDGSKDIPVKSLSGEDHVSAVPDYIRNPSRYTHYTFDSSTDMDEEANRQAYMDFRNLLVMSNTTDAEVSKPIIFTPKKKSTDATMLEIDGESERPVGASKESASYRVVPIAIAARDHEDSDVCAMDEDEPDIETSGRTSSQRIGRQFRTRTSLELDE